MSGGGMVLASHLRERIVALRSGGPKPWARGFTDRDLQDLGLVESIEVRGRKLAKLTDRGWDAAGEAANPIHVLNDTHDLRGLAEWIDLCEENNQSLSFVHWAIEQRLRGKPSSLDMFMGKPKADRIPDGAPGPERLARRFPIGGGAK